MCVRPVVDSICADAFLLMAEIVAQRLRVADANTPASHLRKAASLTPFSPCFLHFHLSLNSSASGTASADLLGLLQKVISDFCCAVIKIRAEQGQL